MTQHDQQLATYRNPWHRPGKPEYGPAIYSTHARPQEYRGHLIFQRVEGHVWDVVMDGQCLTQMAGPNGARQAIDRLLEGPRPAPHQG